MAKARRKSRAGARTRVTSARAVRVVLSTSPKMDAGRIATSLVAGGFAACVNVVPGVISTYRWRGKLTRARESLLLIKTTRSGLSDCLARLAEVHGYEVPEALVMTPGQGLSNYVDWLVKTVRREPT